MTNFQGTSPENSGILRMRGAASAIWLPVRTGHFRTGKVLQGAGLIIVCNSHLRMQPNKNAMHYLIKFSTGNKITYLFGRIIIRLWCKQICHPAHIFGNNSCANWRQLAVVVVRTGYLGGKFYLSVTPQDNTSPGDTQQRISLILSDKSLNTK